MYPRIRDTTTNACINGQTSDVDDKLKNWPCRTRPLPDLEGCYQRAVIRRHVAVGIARLPYS